jgi:hypothetical protein
MSRWYSLLSLLVVSGCLSERNFDERFARAVCKKAKQCDSEGYSEYDKHWECVDEVDGAYSFMKMMLGDCDFNRDKAKTCLKDIRKSSCDEFEAGKFDNACGEVFSNCSGGAFDSGQWSDTGGWDTGG